MKQVPFPPGWDEERVQKVIASEERKHSMEINREMTEKIRRLAREGKLQFSQAPEELVHAHPEIERDFMFAILDYEPDDYMITDESSVMDFRPMDKDRDEWRNWKMAQIRQTYLINLDGIDDLNLARIFDRIAKSMAS